LQAVPLFLSEIAPVERRGAVNILFQFFVTVGIFFANLVNYGTSKMHPYGWRVSLGLAGVPAVFLFIGSIVITETPTSLIERGNETAGQSTLRKIRGVDNVNSEFEQIKAASEIARQVRHPYKKTMKCSSMPTLVIGIQLQIFHQLTGIDAVMFYALGFKNDASLLSAVITGIVNVQAHWSQSLLQIRLRGGFCFFKPACRCS
jgi:MFS family permease